MAEPIVESGVETPMRDGTVLRATVVRPAGSDAAPVPLLLQRNPYLAQMRAWVADVPGLADRPDLPVLLAVGSTGLSLEEVLAAGFAVAVQACRGTHDSDGTFRWMTDEASDGVETARWFAAQPWCDGRVLGFGGSYVSATQLAVALADPDALACVSPWIAPSDPGNDLAAHGGVPLFASTADWASARAHDAAAKEGLPPPADLPRSADDPTGTLVSLTPAEWAERLARYPAAEHAASWLAGEEASYAAGRYAGDELAALDVPGFHVGGWYDIFLSGTLRNYVAMRSGPAGADQHLVVGPWTHADQQRRVPAAYDFGEGSTLLGGGIDRLQLAFWQRHGLPGAAGGSDAMTLPRVRLYVMGADEWRDYPDWPVPDAVERRLFLAGGVLAGEPDRPASTTWTHSPADPVPTIGGQILYGFPEDLGARDQRPAERRDDVASFETPVLDETLTVVGPVRLRAWVEADAPWVDLHATLTDVSPDGTSRILTDGVRRVDTSRGVAEAEVDLWATANAFLPGHRVRLNLAASSWPRYVVNDPGKPVRVTIHHGREHPSALLLRTL